MKALIPTTQAGEAIIGKEKNGCHLKNIGHNDLTLHVLVLRVHVYGSA